MVFSKIETILNGTQHFVACAEDSFKQVELVSEQFENPGLAALPLLAKVGDDDVELLAVAVDATNALPTRCGLQGGRS